MRYNPKKDNIWHQYSTNPSYAEEIAEHRRTCPIILLSGPSGSGKTITAMMLESILDGMGLETHTLSMDHYFKSITPEQLKLAEIGEFDLESPERVDIPFLNQQLKAIRDCEPVELQAAEKQLYALFCQDFTMLQEAVLKLTEKMYVI